MILLLVLVLVFGLAINESVSGGLRGKEGRGGHSVLEQAAHAREHQELLESSTVKNVEGGRSGPVSPHPSDTVVHHSDPTERKIKPPMLGRDGYRHLTPEQRQYIERQNIDKMVSRMKESAMTSTTESAQTKGLTTPKSAGGPQPKKRAGSQVSSFERVLPAVSIESLATRYSWKPPSDSDIAANPKTARLSSTDKALVKEAVRTFTEELRKTPMEGINNGSIRAEFPRK